MWLLNVYKPFIFAQQQQQEQKEQQIARGHSYRATWMMCRPYAYVPVA